MYSRHARRKPYVLSLLPMSIIVVVLVLVSLSLTSRTVSAASPHVDGMNLNSGINPASLRYLTNSISTAESDGAQALVIEINTPGGDLQSMESMKVAELNSTVPIISYVSPQGAYAASAGAFVTLAAQIAAMAPGTTIGASSPVDINGGDLGDTLKAKIESVLVSDMTNIQTRYGRNIDEAIKMVTEAKSYTDQQAKAQGIIDFHTPTLSDLLNQVNVRSVTHVSGHSVTLQTAGDAVLDINPRPVDALFYFLLEPHVAFPLFNVYMVCTFVEIFHSGPIP